MNKALAAEGVEFSKDFVSEYFTWNIGDEDREQRVEKLSYYLPKEINAQAVIADKQWKSTIAREDIILKEVEDMADNRARITFQVKIHFENFAAGQEKKEDDKKSGKVIPEKIETVKYISVPIFYDDEKRRFAVYELPSFTYLDEQKIDESIESETEGLKPIKDGSTQNV
ncbi:conjugal transfer protein, partial [Microvirga sp. 3-52]|nr:conjugal transfer protein [Microvirga sp. 3-52]